MTEQGSKTGDYKLKKKEINELIGMFEQYTVQIANIVFVQFLALTKDFEEDDWNCLWNKVKNIQNNRAKFIAGFEILDHISQVEIYEEYLFMLHSDESLDWDEKYFLWFQISKKLFATANISSEKLIKQQWLIYESIYQKFSSYFINTPLINNRNKDLIFITTQQFLNMKHGPTKTTLDRAYILKKLYKNVIIINTAELLGGKPLELLHGVIGSYNENLLKVEKIEYKDETFSFVQLDNNMPNIENSKEFLDFVIKYKPFYIVNIGGNSLLIDICSRVVPVININTVPSGLTCTKAAVQVIGRQLTEKEENLLALLGKTKENIIVGRFTSSLKPQINKYTRKELDIPEEQFVIALIGGRLTQEVTQEFITMIDYILQKGVMLMIIGKMDNYEDICRKDSIFGQNAVYLGEQDDVLAILELCDLYVNPKRAGGGTSVIEAMYKGCPAVTLNSGDVALGAGPDFCVDSYEEMQKQIFRYMEDKKFYREMSIKAKKRAEYMLDSANAFMEIIHQFENKVL